MHGYHDIKKLIDDFTYLIHRTINERCRNSLAQAYLTYVLQKSVGVIKSKTKEFKTKWRKAFEDRFNLNVNYST